MNEREVQAFLSGLPKHVPQRTAKFRAGQIISDSMHGLSSVGVVENGRVDIYAVALDGRDVQLNSIGAGECFGICNLLVAEPLQTVLRCAEETTVRFWEKEALVAAMRGDAALAMAYAALCNAKIQFLLSRIEMLTMQSCRGKCWRFCWPKSGKTAWFCCAARGTSWPAAYRSAVRHCIANFRRCKAGVIWKSAKAGFGF